MIARPDQPHSCENSAPPGFLTSGHRQDGERWVCPDCGAQWVHACDEAEGCSWERMWDSLQAVSRGEGRAR